VAQSATVARSLADLGEVRRMAEEARRPDLVTRLDRIQHRLTGADVPVAVVGEFKQGKSTLINALLRTEVCPVDADVVTAVPTIVRFGVPPSATAYVGADGETPSTVAVPFDQLRGFVAESPGGPAVRTVEVQLDHRLLHSGMTFIDTPGVGGLDSAHGNITLGVLPLARASLFVTDAAQELTEPELDFLRRIVQGCPTVVCVVTKTDLHAHWRRIVDINRRHLSRAGLALRIVAVSSFLRLHAGAGGDDALNEESGFPELLRILAAEVLGGADAATVAATDRDVTFVLSQLREQIAVERTVVHRPEASAEIAERLAEKAQRSRRLAGASASWQIALSDGIQDLAARVDQDLRERLRSMQRRGEELLDLGDPKDTWADFEAWAAKEATSVAVDNLFALVSRADELAREVAERFDLEYEGLDLNLPALDGALSSVAAPRLRAEQSPGRFLGVFTSARLAAGGVVVAHTAGTLLGTAFLGPVGAVAGLIIGRRLMIIERVRQVEHRRQVARQELRRYVEEVGFVVGNDSRDAVRRAQRYLRDEFSSRALLTERSSAQALAAVRRAESVPPAERPGRARDLDARWQDLGRVSDRLIRSGGGA
jgi:hypothetical protein